MSEVFLDERICLYHGNCLDVLLRLPENSIDACVRDPPYHLAAPAMSAAQRRFAKTGGGDRLPGTDQYGRLSTGFMGKKWDGGDIAFRAETWAAVLRVLKPGAHLVAFGGTRTYHRMACAIEDAGFEIRDMISYVYGSGFPKSHNVRKSAGEQICSCETLSERDVRSLRKADVSQAGNISKECGEVLLAELQEQSASATGRPKHAHNARGEQSGVEGRRDIPKSSRQLRERSLHPVPTGPHFDGAGGRLRDGAQIGDGHMDQEATASDRMCASQRSQTAQQSTIEFGVVAGQSKSQVGGVWENCGRCGKPIVPDGLGTALKPALEPICLARKPLSEGTVAANVLRWGTGAINIDGCRVGTDGGTKGCDAGPSNGILGDGLNGKFGKPVNGLGRWPANLVHDGSEEVLAAFPETADSKAGWRNNNNQGHEGWGGGTIRTGPLYSGHEDSGSSARFFYTAKADADDRLGSKHPTVKPIDLMQWLVRLVTPPKGTALDCFAGTGTTGEAAYREGFNAVLIEAEPEYQNDIRRRMALILAGPEERQREGIKSSGKAKGHEDLPLFSTPNV